MSEHTPGPWAVDETGISIYVMPPKGHYIAHIVKPVTAHWGSDTILLAQANARLIAAAPDLLEALDACLDEMNPMPSGTPTERAREKAFAVIAKAKGEI